MYCMHKGFGPIFGEGKQYIFIFNDYNRTSHSDFPNNHNKDEKKLEKTEVILMSKERSLKLIENEIVLLFFEWSW